jgi:hypothetical protein
VSSDPMFKPEYDGERPKSSLSAPERQQLRQVKAAVIERLHTAMLTLNVMQGAGPLGLRAAGVPQHIVEFSDRVGEEAQEAPRPRFKPTAAEVSDMPHALALLDGLRKPYYTVVKLRALETFARENGESSPWPWERIGALFGLSAYWAQDVYDAAIVQACRRAGLLPLVSMDHAVLIVGCWLRGAWLTNVSTAADPRAALHNLRGKSPIAFEQAVAMWVPSAATAKAVVDRFKAQNRGAIDHASWFKLNPETVETEARRIAQASNIGWMAEDLPVRGAIAA